MSFVPPAALAATAVAAVLNNAGNLRSTRAEVDNSTLAILLTLIPGSGRFAGSRVTPIFLQIGCAERRTDWK